MPIVTDVLRVLETAECHGPLVYLPGLTDSALYERVDRVLTKANATWSFRHEAYLFADLLPVGQAATLIRASWPQGPPHAYRPRPGTHIPRPRPVQLGGAGDTNQGSCQRNRSPVRWLGQTAGPFSTTARSSPKS